MLARSLGIVPLLSALILVLSPGAPGATGQGPTAPTLVPAQQGVPALGEDVDHAGIIRSWTDINRERGRQIYDTHCYSCHGYEGDARLPDARAFNRDPLRAGNDPYTMWLTLTEGFGQMVPQTQYTPEERYDVVHFIREVFIRDRNAEEYFEITDEYLDSLPKGTPREDLIPPDRHPRDYGPVLTSQFRREVNRAMTFDLGQDVFASYDLHRMRLHHVWGGFLNLSETQHMRYRGERQPFPDGEPLDGLQTYHWAFGADFEPAPENALMAGLENSKSMGPTDPELMTYHGHYLDGRTATLFFSIQGREVLERPRVHRRGDFLVLENVIRVAPGATAIQLAAGEFGEAAGGEPVEAAGEPGDVAGEVAEAAGERAEAAGEAAGGGFARAADIAGVLARGDEPSSTLARTGPATDTVAVAGDASPGGTASIGEFVAAAVAGDSEPLRWEVTAGNRLGLHIPAAEEPLVIRVLRFAGNGEQELARFADYVGLVAENGPMTTPDLASVRQGGAPRWTTTIETAGTLDVKRTRYDPIDYRRTEGISPFRVKDRPRLRPAADPAYVIDDLALPDDNPWNAWMRMSALDFFDDGRLAVSTLGGDVWIVTGVDETLENLRWRRFATGLFEPLGLKVIDGIVYVTTRDGIQRLLDLNDDGEADYYEDVYADTDVSNGFHAYNFDLQVDSDGNIYFAKPGRYTDYSLPGAIMKIAPDGSAQAIARGFRVPNGMGIDPADDTLYISGQEGQWVPASKLTIVPVGEDIQPWFGVSQTDEPVFDTFVQPFIWMPRELDNSTAGQLVVRDERFGPLDGKLLHVSFGKGWIYYHMLEEVEGVTQGSVVAMPFQFDAGVQRLRVNPADGQIYVVGLTGWDAEATDRDGNLNRVRYTGAPAYLLTQTHARHDGIELVFSFELDSARAAQASSYVVERWNYRWSARYGSAHWSVDNPDTNGNDPVAVRRAEVGEDGRSVRLVFDDMRPVDQMMIRMDIAAADGTPYKEVTYLTIHRVPGQEETDQQD